MPQHPDHHPIEPPATPPREPDEQVDRLAREVIGAAIEVHRTLGPGFLESVYEAAMVVELTRRRMPVARQVGVAVSYKGEPVGEGRVDLLVDSRLIVEIKTVERLAPIHTAQILSYLKTMQQPLGLLINFNVATLKQGVRRVVRG